MGKQRIPGVYQDGDTVGWYWRWSKPDKREFKAALNELALSLGYVSTANKKIGSVVSVLRAIISGELVVLHASEYKRLKSRQAKRDETAA